MRMVRRVGFVFALVVFLLMPMGAGAAGHGPLAMLAFAGMFLLANAVVRPASVRLDAPGQLAAQVLTASAFAALLVGLGQSIRALGQIEASLGLPGWVFVSAWALVLARLVWPPRLNDGAMDAAESALKTVHEAGGGDAAAPPETAPVTEPPVSQPDDPASVSEHEEDVTIPGDPVDPALAEALSRLDTLPEEGAGEADLSAALETLSGAAPLARVFAALRRRAGTERDRRALVRHATDPWVAEQRAGAKEPAMAFEAVVEAADARSLADFASLSFALLDMLPAARRDMPEVSRLLEIADQIEGELEAEAELLVGLAHRLEDLELEAENGADA